MEESKKVENLEVLPAAEEDGLAVGDEEAWQPRRQEYLIMVSLSLISLMVALDASILVPSLPALASALHGTANEAFWAGSSYLLTSSVCQPFLAALSDIFGRQHMLFASIFLFLVGTILCCAANDFIVVLAGRSIQGIGGGGIMSLVLIVFSDIVPLRQRPIYLSYVQAAWALGSITGPVIGGAIVQNSTWRWIFYINFPFCVFGLVTIPLVVRLKTSNRASFVQKLFSVDWIGGIMFNCTTATLLLGLTWGGIQYPWSSFQTLLPIFLGLAGIVVTIVWELKFTKVPFLRLGLFANRSMAAVYVCAIVQGMILYGDIYYIPFYFEVVKGYSPVLTGVGVIPITAGMIPTSIIIGRLVSRWGRFRWAIWSGWAVTLLGTGLLILLDVEIPTWKWVLCLLVLGLGHGMILSTLTYTTQVISSSEDGPYALAMYTAIRTFGTCVGIAVTGTAFQNFLKTYLQQAGLPTEIANNAESYVQELLAYPADSAYRILVVSLYAKAFRSCYEVLVGISIVGGLAGLCIRGHSMDRPLESGHVLDREK